MRDLVLAEELRQQHEVIFASQNLEGNINNRIKAHAFHLHVLHSNRLEELIDVIHQYEIETVIVDHYGIDASFEQELKKRTDVALVVFDDTYMKHYCDVVLNHNPGAQSHKYNGLVPSYASKLCGIRYTLIRDEFRQARIRQYRKTPKGRMTLLIMMGGSDPTNITYSIAKELLQKKSYELHIVTTTSNIHLKKLQQLTQQQQAMNLHVNSQQVSLLMQKADIAVISASVTAAEALYMRLPFIAIQTAENQHEIYRYLKSQRLPVLSRFQPRRFHTALRQCSKNYDTIVRRLKRIHFSTKDRESIF